MQKKSNRPRRISLIVTATARTLGTDFDVGHGKFSMMHGIEADTMSYNIPPPAEQKLFAHNVLFKAQELALDPQETKMILEMLGLVDTTGNVRLGNRPNIVTREATLKLWR